VTLRACCFIPLVMLSSCQTLQEPVTRAPETIVDGDVSSSADDAVVQVTTDFGPCSGTLIAKNLVLTARHCVIVKDYVVASCRVDGTASTDTGAVLGEIDAAQIKVHVGANASDEPVAEGLYVLSAEGGTICRNDIALVVLDRHLDQVPIIPIRLTRPTTIGERMTVVGYGVTGRVGEAIDQGDADVPVVRLRREGVRVLDLGSNRFGKNGDLAAPGTFVLGPCICQGDSGGPAIVETTGAVAGVASIVGAMPCLASETNAFVQLAEYYDLILQAFALAGAEPWIEGESSVMQRQRPQVSGCSLLGNAIGCSHSHRGGMSVATVLVLVACCWIRRARTRRDSHPFDS
jgi:secreted trypsin-like serine protease